MRIDVLTTFPELFATQPPGVLGVSIPGRAIAKGRVELHTTNIRDHAEGRHRKTDDRPFGGGPGMVMLCQPLWDAVHAAEALDGRRARRVLLTPQGRPLCQQTVEALASEPRLLIICGHYEGIDERVVEALDPLELSIGDYVLSSGELAALVLLDALLRLLPGVLGDAESAGQDSFSTAPERNAIGEPLEPRDRAALLAQLGVPENASLLDCPHYTRPRVWRGREVPEPLLSGDHDAVLRWRIEQRVARTRARRPDLLTE